MLIKSVWRNLLFLVLSSVSISKLYFLLHTGISPFIQKLLGSSCSYTLFWHFDLLYLFINIYSVGQFWNLNWSGFQHFYNKFGKTFFFFFLNKRKKNSFAWKIILLRIKPIAWAYSMLTLGTETLNSVFSFYYVKLFLYLYKITEVAFYQAQVRWSLHYPIT